MGDISFLSRSAMAESRVLDDAFPQNLSLDNMLSAAVSLSGNDPTRSAVVSNTFNQQNRLSNAGQPVLDRETTEQYLQGFLKTVCVRHPHLSRVEVSQDYEATIGSDVIRQGSVPEDMSFMYFNTCLAVATGMLMSEDSASLALPAASFYSAAIRQIPVISEADGPLAMIHCMLNLVIFSLASNFGGSAWHVIGIVMNQCISLGLHKEPESDEIAAHDQLRRRNLFWSAYLLDRCIGSVLGRPFGIQDEDITVRVS